MELAERMAAVEKVQEIQGAEIIRLRDNAGDAWKAIERSAAQGEVANGKIDQMLGSMHLIAQNAASVAIERYRTESAPSPVTSMFGAMVKTLGVLAAIIAALLGIKYGAPG